LSAKIQRDSLVTDMFGRKFLIMHRRYGGIFGFVFTGLACGSLVLCALALLLWPVGYWRRVNINYTVGKFQVDLQTASGTVAVGRYVYPRAVPRFLRGWNGRLHQLEPDDGGLLDFGRLHRDRLSPSDNLYDAAWCPNWFMAVLLGILPTIWLMRYRKRRERWLKGRCRRCGYDLRATPDRCPECGEHA
jgi:hypothetical protein